MNTRSQPGRRVAPVNALADALAEWLLLAIAVLRAILLAGAIVAMTGGGQGGLVVLVGRQSALATAFRQVQVALMPWLARTPDELTQANALASVLVAVA